MQLTEHIPIKPPVQIPKRTNDLNLGMKSAAVVELDGKRSELEDGVRLNALKKRDEREDDGVGDQLMEIQQVNWPVDKILNGGV